MKRLLSILFLLTALSCKAQLTSIVATVTFTNGAGTVNGQTISVNGNLRTFTNNVVSANVQILTNSTAVGAASNTFLFYAIFPEANLSLSQTTPTNVLFTAYPGFNLTVLVTALYGKVTYTTNIFGGGSNTIVVRGPLSMLSLYEQTNVASFLTAGLNSTANTNAITDSSTFATGLAGLSKVQQIAGETVINKLSFGIQSITLANGANVDVDLAGRNCVFVTGPSSAFSVGGFLQGTNGQPVILLNLTGQNMTLTHESGSEATTTNRIITMTGSDAVSTGNGAAILVYSNNTNRWCVVSFSP